LSGVSQFLSAVCYDREMPETLLILVADCFSRPPSWQLKMLASSMIPVQMALLSLSILLASRQEEEGSVIPPVSVQEAAQLGLRLYEQYGGSKKLRLPQALADGDSVTSKDIDEILDFFENAEIDGEKPGWGNQNYPSAEWIRWLLMGGDLCWQWANTVKELGAEIDEKPSDE
jgi:hypothetical protein